MSHPVDRAQLDTVSALGTRGWKSSRFAGAARMAASTRWRHASQSRIAGSGGILPPTDTVFLYTPVDSPGCTPSRRGHGLLPRLQTRSEEHTSELQSPMYL